MPNLKDLRSRIKSVKETRKITAAMKMVAGAKFRKSEKRMLSNKVYTQNLNAMMHAAMKDVGDYDGDKTLLLGHEDAPACYLVFSPDKGLCGSFNGALVRYTRKIFLDHKNANKPFKYIVFGKKAQTLLDKGFSDHKIDLEEEVLTGKEISFEQAHDISQTLVKHLQDKTVGSYTCIYNVFENSMTQTPVLEQLIPHVDEKGDDESFVHVEMEPTLNDLLPNLLSHFLCAKLYQYFLESFTGEQAARMSAMDNATRNADDMIKNLELKYNRTRQAVITTELTEIVAGAEAL